MASVVTLIDHSILNFISSCHINVYSLPYQSALIWLIDHIFPVVLTVLKQTFVLSLRKEEEKY